MAEPAGSAMLCLTHACSAGAQDHTKADRIAKIQQDLDQTNVLLYQSIQSLLRRGETLDQLLDKSNDLSLASQMFAKRAKKLNSCC